MREVVNDILIDGHHLSVIVTEPKVRSNDKAVLLITAGLLHKVGPYRMYTLLARQLAESGILTIRFDLTSIGDSSYIPLSNIAEQSHRDISQVLDHIRDQYKVGSFIAGGLCAGAEDAFNFATVDNRIKAVFMLDPNVYETPKGKTKAVYYKALRHAKRKLQFSSYLREVYSRDMPSIEEKLFYRPELDKNFVEDNINSLIDRGCKLLFLFMGGNVNKYNYKEQVRDMYSRVTFNSLIEYDYFKDFDHSTMLEADRLEIIKKISQWVLKL